MNWNSVIEQLRAGDNKVLGTFHQEYSVYCINKLMRENKCSNDDAQDIFIDSIINLREKLICGKVISIENPKQYLFKTCYYMFLKRIEERTKKQKKLDDLECFYYESDYQTEDRTFDEQLLKVTMDAWGFLSERCKDILNYYYIDKLDMAKIADLMNLSNSNVAKTTKARCYKTFVEKGAELKNAIEKTS